MPTLSTVESVNTNRIPSQATMDKILATVTTVEGAEYSLARINEKFMSSRVIDPAKLTLFFDEYEIFVDYVRLQRESHGNPFLGDLPASTGFQTFQKNLAAKVARLIDKTAITFDFAISERSKLIRRYHSKGEPLDPSVMDTLFNAWLAENNMIIKDRVVYEVTDSGKIKQDKDGPVRVSPDKHLDLVESKDKGYAKYVHKQNAKVNLTTSPQVYTGEETLPRAGTSGSEQQTRGV